jgi:FtsP/CotA-like multicopper oxidase with cupredoxin domain
MTTRRTFIKVGVATGAGAYVLTKGFWSQVFSQVPGGSLTPDEIPKFVRPLVILPPMPQKSSDANTDYYAIAVRQFRQQILPLAFPATTVWGYGSANKLDTFHYPAYTIEATAQRQIRATWVNQLVDNHGKYLPHLLPVDQTLHWANPPGGVAERDMPGHDPESYRGPVPIVTHVHGGHSPDESDGYPEAWYLPAATNIPAGHARTGRWYEYYRAKFSADWGGDWAPGSATFLYPNDQRATALWYHDHALGLTRVNVYAGPVGFYLIRGGPDDLPAGQLPGPAPAVGDPPGTRYYEIPLVIQDRSFDNDGSLFYPDNRAFFEALKTSNLKIPFIPEAGCMGPSDVAPIWNPEFFGNTIVVNGRTWPYLNVEQRRYRFRVLNGCNTRFLILKLSRDGLPFWQIGADGGFLPAPIDLNRLLIAPGERADVIVDFADVPVGTEILLQNLAPDEPFGGGEPGRDFVSADPVTTGQVMQFRVVAAQSPDLSVPPQSLALPTATRLPDATFTRQLSVNELESQTVFVSTQMGHGRRAHQPSKVSLSCREGQGVPFGPTQALLGTLTSEGQANPLHWMHEVTENPAVDSVEIWEIHNLTEDAHPLHIHHVQFEIVERVDENGVSRGPESWETGTKDTMIVYPKEIIRIKARFDRAGQYVWHCHILEHEDNEMMRPYAVGPVQTPKA